MPTIADVFVRVRVANPKTLKKDVDDALNGVDTDRAGRRAGAGFSDGFDRETSKRSKKSGGNFMQEVAKGITLKSALIGGAVTAGLAILPATFAAAGIAGGLGLGAALILGLAKVDPKIKAAGKKLGENFSKTLQASGKSSGITDQLTNGINHLTRLALPALGTVFTAIFRAMKPLIPPITDGLTHMAVWLEHHINPAIAAFQRYMIGLKGPTGILIGQLKSKVWPDISKFLALMAGGAGNSIRAFGNLLVAISPLFPALGLVSNFAATLIGRFPLLASAILGVVAAIKIFALVSKLEFVSTPIGLVITALAVGALLVIRYWKPISAFFAGLGRDVFNGFIQPLINWFTKSLPHAFGLVLAALAQFGIWVVRGFQIVTNGILTFVGTVIHAAATAFGWIPGIGGKLKDAAKSFDNFKAGVNNSFNGTIASMSRWRDQMKAMGTTSGRTTKGILADFGAQQVAAKRSKADLDRYSRAIAQNGVNSQQARAARLRLIADLIKAGVNSTTANRDVNAYTQAVREHGARSDQARAARLRLNHDIAIASHNSKIAKEDMFRLRDAIRTHGVQSDQARAARLRMIHDLVQAGATTDGATRATNRYVNYLTHQTHSALGGTIRGLGALAATYNSIASTLGVRVAKVGAAAAKAIAGLFAEGGQIPGNGGPKADNMLAMVSSKEWVMPVDAVNHYGPGFMSAVQTRQLPRFANGGQIVSTALRYNGHPYTWGGSPPGHFDCSSFVNMILDMNHIPVPGGWHIGQGHGPVTTNYLGYGGGISYGAMQPGDLYVSSTHMGIVTGPGRGFAARSTATGTGPQGVGTWYHIRRGPWGPGGSFTGAPGMLTPAQQKKYDAAIAFMNAALHAQATPPFAGLRTTAVHNIAAKEKSNLTAAYAAMQAAFLAAQGGNPGTPGIPTGVTASAFGIGNLITIGKYLMQHGATRIAAAGITGDIYGESAGNPESVGSGGFGLIGWTGNTIGLPPGYRGPTGNLNRDLAIQMAGTVGYINANGGMGPINAARSVTEAGQIFSRKYERPLVLYSDTRPAIAQAVYNKLHRGGVLPEDVYGIGPSGARYQMQGGERVVSGSGDDVLIRELRALRQALEAVPGRTAAGVVKGISAPKGSEAQAARLGAR